MEANKITLKTFAAAIAAILFLEALFTLMQAAINLSSIAALGLFRCLETVLLVVIVLRLEKDTAAIGLARSGLADGFKKGLIWSAGFGIIIGVVYSALLAGGINALQFFGSPPAWSQPHVFSFLLVGGIIGPITEEIFFRGIVYGFFRKWGATVAIIASTLLFVFLHPTGVNLPLTQTVGGILFAVAYEKEQNLIVPITIHCLGNIAIFALTIFT